MNENGPLQRARRNPTSIVSSFVTGTWLLALVAGFDWWLWFMLFGYVVLVPTVSRLFVDSNGEWHEGERREDDEEWEDGGEGWRGHSGTWWDDAHTGDETVSNSTPGPNNKDALETLRERYARGELTDDQFERKVERLLETETLEDVEDWARESASGGGARTGDAEREPSR